MKKILPVFFVLVMVVTCLADKYLVINHNDGTSKTYDYSVIKNIKFYNNESITYNFIIEVRDSLLNPVPFADVYLKIKLIRLNEYENFSDQQCTANKKIALWNGVIKDTSNLTQYTILTDPPVSLSSGYVAKGFQTDEKGILVTSIKAPAEYPFEGLYDARSVLPGVAGLFGTVRMPIKQMLAADAAGFGTTNIHLIFMSKVYKAQL